MARRSASVRVMPSLLAASSNACQTRVGRLTVTLETSGALDTSDTSE